MAEPNQRYRLFKTGIKLDILRGLPDTGRVKILEDNNFGYQLETSPEPFRNRSYQDVMIYAYRK
jgi:hypothetical protein